MENLKYKVGDEVLIKGVVTELRNPNRTDYPYKIRFDSDRLELSQVCTFTEVSVVGKVNNQKTYEQGLNDAWVMAKIIMDRKPQIVLAPIYDGYVTFYDIAHNFSAQEVIDKYNAWKEKQKFKMGDIVEYDVAGGCERAIFYSEGPQVWWLLSKDNAEPLYLCKEDFALRKIGESGLDISGALANIEKLSETSVKAGRE